MQQLDLFVHLMAAEAPLPCIRLADGRTISYTLKRSARAKNVWLRIGIGTGLVVTAPQRLSMRDLLGVLERKSGWILKQHLRMDLRAKPRPALRTGATLPYLGEGRRLRVLFSRSELSAVNMVDGEIIAAVPDYDPAVLRDALEKWYRKSAREVIVKRVGRLANGGKVGKVTIKDQKTRWGSCSSRGNLNFNWRLVMAPPRVIDYLIIHELTHLEHQDHSSRFWARVEKRCPDYRESEAWLKRHGRDLVIP